MTKFITMVMIALAMVRAQDSNSVQSLMTLSGKLGIAVEAGDWKSAAELSKELAEAATRARNASLSSSTAEQVNRALDWLPDDTETLLVASEPFSLTEETSNSVPNGAQLARGYILGLLGAPDEGKIYKAFVGRTLRYAVSQRAISRLTQTTAAMPCRSA